MGSFVNTSMYRIGAIVITALAFTLFGLAGITTLHAAEPAIAVPAKGKSPHIDAIMAAGKLRSAVAVALPVIGQNPQNGEYFGVGVEIPKRVAEVLGVKLEIIPAAWDVMIAGLQSDRWDMVTGGLYATPARLKVVDMVTYKSGGFCYAVLKSNPRINEVKDLDNASVRIGTFTGTGTYQAVSKAHPDAKYDLVVQGPGQSLRIDDLLAGRVDAAPFDSPLGYVLEAQYPQVKIVPGGGANCVKAPDVPTPSGLALPQGDPVYTAFVRDIVSQMQSSGEMTQLLAKFSSPEFMRIVK